MKRKTQMMNLRIIGRSAGHAARSRDASPKRTEEREASDLSAVESLMVSLARSRGAGQLSDMAVEQLSRGGRRVRARLALAAATAFGAERGDAVAWAAGVELLHNATLVHDDIQDGDQLRRGKPTIWARYGIAQAINVGDFLLMLPYVALSEVSPCYRGELAILLAETSTRIVRGQVEELALIHEEKLDAASYYSAAEGKTGALFELPVAGAGIVAGKSESEVDALRKLFAQIGVIFQLQDDVIDLFGNKGREQAGSDVREGKVSALIVELVRHRPDLRGTIVEILKKPREETTDREVEFIISWCRDSGALASLLGTIEEMKDRVLDDPICRQDPIVRKLALDLLRLCLAPLEQVYANLPMHCEASR
jgi:geranylgeranyl diphosphate synthase, type I